MANNGEGKDRRTFVVVGLGVAASLPTILAGCGAPTGQAEARGSFPAGNVSQISVGQLKLLENVPIVLGRDTAGLYAMSTICTHRACDIAESGEVSNQGLTCDCHGSVFDANGAVVNGPAKETLSHYQVTVDVNGNITIDADTEVSPTARTPVQ